MQPVIADLEGLQQEWNKNAAHRIASPLSPEKKILYGQRPAYLRAVQVAMLALGMVSASMALCLGLSGVIAPIAERSIVIACGKVLTAAFFGIVAHDSLKLWQIADRSRRIFREALRYFNSVKTELQLNQRDKERWNEEIKRIKREYKELVFIDSFLDNVYPIIVNH